MVEVGNPRDMSARECWNRRGVDCNNSRVANKFPPGRAGRESKLHAPIEMLQQKTQTVLNL